MAYLRFTLWISLLFYDFEFIKATDSIHGQQITLLTLENLQSLKELQFDESFRLSSVDKLIIKRNTDDQPSSPQIFKFELDDAKEPDEETKKLIQMRARELRLEEQKANTTDTSKRSKRAAQKVKPELIPFLITDAKEPDNATKELIRRSRAKELSLMSANKEPSIRQSRHKDDNSEFSNQKREPSTRQSRGKNFASIATNKESLRVGRVKSVALTHDDRAGPVRQVKVQSVPPTTTATDQESLRVNRATSTATQKRQRSSKKSPKKRTRRFAQLTEPRFIKFELHDVKASSDNDNSATEVQILPRPVFGAKISNQAPEPNTSQQLEAADSSVQGSKYRYFIQQAPRKPHYGPYPKRYEHGNDIAFRVGKMQKYIASGQGLENINTNIEINLPPAAVTATAIVSGYPKHVYGQKICPYGNHGCQVGPLAPRANAVPETQQQEFHKPSQNSVAENEVLPERQPQRYYYNFYTHPQPEVNQQFIPLVKPYQPVAQILQTPLIEHQQPLHSHQEPLVPQQIHVVDNKLTEQNPLLELAYLEPTYGYGNKLYPYTNTIPPNPVNNDQSANGQFDDGRNQEVLHQSKIYEDQARKLDLLKNNQEFQELSTLIGKSPMDQVHGLSYLLAKEMQRQKNAGTQQRPQDQTSPILFHPKENTSTTNSQSAEAAAEVQKQTIEDSKVESNQVTPFRPLRQLNKNIPPPTVQPVHIVHPVQNVEPVQTVQPVHFVQTVQPIQTVQTVEPVQLVQPVQTVQHVQTVQTIQPVQQDPKRQVNSGDDGLGISPNYNGIDSHNYLTQTIYPKTENDAPLEYASKYSFGYRVRDLHSGNDFFHKQKRDEDGVTRGQYHILMPDGRIQNVIYYADDTGFHADCSKKTSDDEILSDFIIL